MGEARYYMRAEYGSAEGAEDARPRILAFLQRMNAAEDYWQEHRGEGETQLRDNFLDVMTILDIPPAGDDDHSLNSYAGQLDAPDMSGFRQGGDGECFTNGTAVLFSGTVWHLASWERLENAMRQEFGALTAGWLSEEDVEPDFYALAEQHG